MDIGPVRVSDYSIYSAQPVTPPENRTERRELIQAVKAVNKAELFGQDNELTFSVDSGSRKPVIKLVNRKTREVVRQIPAEYLLRLSDDLKSSQR